jgi:hypothetical protein
MTVRLLAIVAAIGLIGACATASGCGGDSSSDGGSKASTSSNESSSESSKQTKAPPAAREPVPASLGAVESGAEDTIDFAAQGDRARVVATTRKLERVAAGRAARDLRKAGVPEEQLAALRARAQVVAAIAPRAKLIRVSLGANQVSALMPDLYARYTDPVPPAVLRLDYLDREAELRSLVGDQASVRVAVAALRATWASLRRELIDAGGRRVAAAFARHVAAMRRLARGSDAEALRAQAAIGLELVDRLEQVFRR